MRRLVPSQPLDPLRRIESFFYVAGGILIPAVCFFATAAVEDLYKPTSQRDGWRGVLGLFFHRDANGGFGLLLVASAVALALVLANPRRYAKAVAVRVLVLGGAVIAVTYFVLGAFAHRWQEFLAVNVIALAACAVFRRFAALRPGADFAFLIPFLLAVGATLVVPATPILLLVLAPLAGPAWALVAYWAMWRRLEAQARADRVLVEAFGEPAPQPRLLPPLLLWLLGYGAAFAHALVEAKRLYAELPADPPPECYVATAAARGHPRFVGSWRAGDRRVNAQLVRLKAGEIVLARFAPRLHRLVRRAYDRVGPLLAARLRHPLAADLAYLSLKPLEWAVRAVFLVPPRPPFDPAQRALHWRRCSSPSSSSSPPTTRRR